VTKGAAQLSDPSEGFELAPLHKVINGPSHGELLERPFLKDSEPLRFNNQGTLFALTADEVSELAEMIGENDPEGARLLTEADGTATLTWVTFHPSYAYEDFVEGLRPFETGSGQVGLRLEDGVFKRLCRVAESQPGRRFLLVIDELNRANGSPRGISIHCCCFIRRIPTPMPS
jgi:5-methylcytosine-specific restriction protein B